MEAAPGARSSGIREGLLGLFEATPVEACWPFGREGEAHLRRRVLEALPDIDIPSRVTLSRLQLRAHPFLRFWVTIRRRTVMGNTSLETDLIGGIEKREIRMVDYDPTWPAKFELHRAIIAKALSDVALQIEHIGSSSVPGLAAKPIIDILVVVEDSTEESTYLPQLDAVGYLLRVREPDWNDHRMLRTPERDVHVHVYSAGCREIERSLTFRERLRTNAGDRRRYEATKRALAKRDWPHMNAYANAKTEVIEDIIAAARAAGEVSA
jgi:GrpB-like predicted nucleotidyltransferase (UPF0157 family)